MCFRNSFVKHNSKPLNIIRSVYSKAPIISEESINKNEDLMDIDIVEEVNNSKKLTTLPTPLKESIKSGLKLAPKRIGLSLPTPLKNTIKNGTKLIPKKIGESLPLELKTSIVSGVPLKTK